MGGYMGVAAKEDCVFDLYFGIDYHSHLGTRRGGMVVYDDEKGFDRSIHNIENAPFRTKFDKDMQSMKGRLGIGCISDYEPQPLMVRSHHGTYAITTVSKINNTDELVQEIFSNGNSHFLEMSGGEINPTELVATLINQKENLIDGINYALEKVDGSLSLLLMNPNGIYCARDKYGRTPIAIGKKEDAFCAAFENFSYKNLKHGTLLMLWGYFKKMVIADRAVSLIQMVAPDYMQYNGTVIFITVLVYALQLYADFSGGIDISRGFAEILGIEMAENFCRPYFAVSINDYWRRWHITLGAWMKNYVFYSLAMSKRFFKMGKNLKQKYGDHAVGAHIAKVLPAGIASFITFLLVGIWHGANMKYVAFGVWNGSVILLSVLMQPLFNKAIAGLHIQTQKTSWRIFQILRTFLIVLIGYMFDIGNNFSAAIDMLGRCVRDFSFDITQIIEQITSCGMTLYDYMLLIFMTVLIFYVSLIQERHSDTTIRKLLEEKYPKFQWIVLFAGLLSIAIFGMYGPGCSAAEFVYMQF